MLERIILATCQYFGIDEAALSKTNCDHDTIYRRNICLYLIKENVYTKNIRIAQRLKLDSGSTVYRGVEKIRDARAIAMNLKGRNTEYAQTLHDLEGVMQIANNLAR